MAQCCKNTSIYCVGSDVACEVQHKWRFIYFAVRLPFKMLNDNSDSYDIMKISKTFDMFLTSNPPAKKAPKILEPIS